MGLREKALKYEQESLQTKFLKEEDIPQNEPVSQDRQDTLDQDISKEVSELNVVDITKNMEPISQESLHRQNGSGDTETFLHSGDLHSISRPLVGGLEQQNQVEALLNLIELAKELSGIMDENELWDTIIITLIGQLGSKEAAIFLQDKQGLILKANQGFIVEKPFTVSIEISLLQELIHDNGLIYIENLVPKLNPVEKMWFRSLNADILVPIIRFEEIIGFIIIGKPIAFLDYNLEDLTYLKALGELLGSYYESINKIIKISEQIKTWEKRKIYYNGFKKYLDSIEKATTMEALDRYFLEILQNDHDIDKFIFLIKEHKKFYPSIHRGLEKKTIEKFHLSTKDPLIIEVKNHENWYEYTAFLDNSKFIKKFSAGDLSLLKRIFIFPLCLENELEGIFFIFEIRKNLEREDLQYLNLILRNYYWAFLASKKNRSLETKTLEDPLYALRELVSDHETDLKSKQIPFLLILLSIENAKSLRNLKGEKGFEKQKMYFKSTLISMISEKDNCMEIFPNQFFLTIQGKTPKDAEHLLRRLEENMSVKYRSEAARPLWDKKILSRPDDPATSIDSFLFG